VKRGDIRWADLPPPSGRRPVLIVTRDEAIPVLTSIVVAEITGTVRGIRSEVPVGSEEGLDQESVANCDSLATVRKTIVDPLAIGSVRPEKMRRLDSALRFALGIRH
jgi:mRNA interferase MazF